MQSPAIANYFVFTALYLYLLFFFFLPTVPRNRVGPAYGLSAPCFASVDEHFVCSHT